MKTPKLAVEKLTIGLDLGDRRHHACVLSATGEILAEEPFANTREVLTAFAARYHEGRAEPVASQRASGMAHLLNVRRNTRRITFNPKIP